MHHLISHLCTICLWASCLWCSCPIGRLASFCWLSSLLRHSWCSLILVSLGWRHPCCCCCTCVMLVMCRLMLTLRFEIFHIVKIVVVIIAIWKTHTVPCSLTRLLFQFLCVSFLLVTRLPFCFLLVRCSCSDWRSEVASCSDWRSEG
jgi:hypothetical protein